MAMLPHMTVMRTADFEQTRQATLAVADMKGRFTCVLDVKKFPCSCVPMRL